MVNEEEHEVGIGGDKGVGSDEITAGFLLWQHPKAKYGYIWAKTYHTCPVFVVSP